MKLKMIHVVHENGHFGQQAIFMGGLISETNEKKDGWCKYFIGFKLQQIKRKKSMSKCQNCGARSTLRCPSCVSLGLVDAHFCQQQCFKTSWSKHKLVHATTKKYNPWPQFNYTGNMRPIYPLSTKRPVKKTIQVPDYAMHPEGYSQSEQAIRGSNKIKICSSEEIIKMRNVCILGRQILEIGAKAIVGNTLIDFSWRHYR
jgi:hypothetical protein